MYCPKCGHQAASNNVRYCPGCGFWLHGVAELIANKGVFATDEETPSKPRRSMVKRGALLGATLMFLGQLFILFVLNGNKAEKEIAFLSYWVGLILLIGVSGYLKRLITNIFNIFSEEEPSPSKKSASPSGFALPEAYNAPVADSGRQFVDTAKAPSSSIIEQTTSRLNKV